MVNNNSNDADLDAEDKIHQNGTAPETTPEATEQTADPGLPSTKYENRRPSPDEDLFQRHFGGSQSDPLEAVHTASDDPKEYLVRSYLPDRTIKLILLQNAQTSGVLLGMVNPAADNVMLMHMVRSAEGRGNSMERMERMYTGKQAMDRAEIGNHFANRVSKFNTLNNEQVQTSPQVS